MTEYTRFALYHAPVAGAFAEKAASWLGWDVDAGTPVPHPDVPGLPKPIGQITKRPRKYGFHATLRAPFRLAVGMDADQLVTSCNALAAELAPVSLQGLQVDALGPFLAFRPVGETQGLNAFAKALVIGSNDWRAPLNEAEIAKRNPDKLSERQRDLMMRYGYPFIFEDFQFHMTLTGPLDRAELSVVQAALLSYFEPVLTSPYIIEDICLFGERVDGSFVMIERIPLAG